MYDPAFGLDGHSAAVKRILNPRPMEPSTFRFMARPFETLSYPPNHGTLPPELWPVSNHRKRGFGQATRPPLCSRYTRIKARRNLQAAVKAVERPSCRFVARPVKSPSCGFDISPFFHLNCGLFRITSGGASGARLGLRPRQPPSGSLRIFKPGSAKPPTYHFVSWTVEAPSYPTKLPAVFTLLF